MLFALQGVCSFLFAVGALFILIDLRTKFDRTFRFFGASLIILCSMTAIDLWITPGMSNPQHLLYAQRFYHFLACLFIPSSVWYLLILTNSRFIKYMPMIFGYSFLLTGFFLSEKMLYISNGLASGGTLYNLIFVPFVAVYVLSSNYIIISKLIISVPSERKILIIHLFGFFWLCICGILDIALVSTVSNTSMPSYTILGVMGYGLMAAFIFTERFLIILKERAGSYSKLESAYKDLEEVNALKQLGESTAIINHEIKNYMFMISGNAQILEEIEPLSQKGKEVVRNIISSVERLTNFSEDILNLSRTQIVKATHTVNLSQVIKGTIEKHFYNKKAFFNLRNLHQDHFIYGDWGKLEQVFLNIFKNSFEASPLESADIKVRVFAKTSVVVISIEDFGTGCNQEQLNGLFKAFYTSKKGTGGTGLGMSISRTIIESHGGKISAYSKNLTKTGEHGLKLIMTFPTFVEKELTNNNPKHPIVLIKNEMDNFSELIRIFQNVAVSPYVIQDTSELNTTNFPPDKMTILVSPKTMTKKFIQLAQYPKLCLVSQHENNLYILDQNQSNRAEIFSEEYVINKLIHKKVSPIRSRIRERQSNVTS